MKPAQTAHPSKSAPTSTQTLTAKIAAMRRQGFSDANIARTLRLTPAQLTQLAPRSNP